MGIIKEPAGIDLNIGPMPLTNEDRQVVSAIIAQYKATGNIPDSKRKPKSTAKRKAGVSAKKEANRGKIKTS
jgi:hypothetical protein